MANPTMTLISSQTLGASTATVTFSSIPATYNDLRLICSLRTSAVGTNIGVAIVRFNGDSATNYSATILNGNNGTAASGRQTSQTADYPANENIAGTTNTANTFGLIDLYLPNYNSTGSRPAFSQDAMENNTAGANILTAQAYLYRGSSAITSISINANTDNFVANSNFYLYGIKNS